jgi:hypothetical protein
LNEYRINVWGIIALLLVVAALLLEQTVVLSDQALYERAVAGSRVTAPEIDFVRGAVQSIAKKAGEKRSLQVNGKFNKAAINVALVDRYDAPGLREVKRGFGIRAVSTNTLLIDSALVRDLLLASVNDMNYFSQFYDSIGENEQNYLTPPEDGSDTPSRKSAATFGAISLQLRLENFSRGYDVSDKYGAMIASELASSAPDMLPDYFIPFTFPISHELYHMRRDRKLALNASAEEIAADEFAVGVVSRESAHYRTTPNIGFLRGQLLFVGIRYLQDRVLGQLLHGFRGNDADAYLSALYHVECKYAKQILWPMRFNNPGTIRIGEYRNLPLMSDDEILAVRRFLDQLQDAEHPNLLRRIISIADAIDADPILGPSARLVFTKSRALLEIHESGRATRSMFLPDDERTRAGTLDSQSLITALGGVIKRTSAQGCEARSCLLATVGAGYAELFNEDGRIDLGTHVQPPTLDGIRSLEIAAERYIGEEHAHQLMGKIRASRSACRLASGIYRGERYIVTVRTMNQDGWTELRAYSVQ